jgi:hypothetical protein
MEMFGLGHLAQTATPKMPSPLMDQHAKPEIIINPVTSSPSPSWTVDVDRFIHRKFATVFFFLLPLAKSPTIPTNSIMLSPC